MRHFGICTIPVHSSDIDLKLCFTEYEFCAMSKMQRVYNDTCIYKQFVQLHGVGRHFHTLRYRHIFFTSSTRISILNTYSRLFFPFIGRNPF